jgi:hypothetical protein
MTFATWPPCSTRWAPTAPRRGVAERKLARYSSAPGPRCSSSTGSVATPSSPSAGTSWRLRTVRRRALLVPGRLLTPPCAVPLCRPAVGAASRVLRLHSHFADHGPRGTLLPRVQATRQGADRCRHQPTEPMRAHPRVWRACAKYLVTFVVVALFTGLCYVAMAITFYFEKRAHALGSPARPSSSCPAQARPTSSTSPTKCSTTTSACCPSSRVGRRPWARSLWSAR